jgi:hypothetical protein
MDIFVAELPDSTSVVVGSSEIPRREIRGYRFLAMSEQLCHDALPELLHTRAEKMAMNSSCE